MDTIENTPPSFQPMGITMPLDPYLRPDDINTGLDWMQRQRRQAKEDEAAAIRWQGQQDYARELESGRNAGLDDFEASMQAFLKAGPKLFRDNPQAMIPIYGALQRAKNAVPRLTPAQKEDLTQLEEQERDLRTELNRLKKESGEFIPPKAIAVPNAKGVSEEVPLAPADMQKRYMSIEKKMDADRKADAVIKQLDAVRAQKRSKLGLPVVGEPAIPTPATPQATQPTASPFPEGSVIRNKRDGKLYKIVNGVPVAQE